MIFWLSFLSARCDESGAHVLLNGNAEIRMAEGWQLNIQLIIKLFGQARKKADRQSGLYLLFCMMGCFDEGIPEAWVRSRLASLRKRWAWNGREWVVPVRMAPLETCHGPIPGVFARGVRPAMIPLLDGPMKT